MIPKIFRYDREFFISTIENVHCRNFLLKSFSCIKEYILIDRFPEQVSPVKISPPFSTIGKKDFTILSPLTLLQKAENELGKNALKFISVESNFMFTENVGY